MNTHWKWALFFVPEWWPVKAAGYSSKWSFIKMDSILLSACVHFENVEGIAIWQNFEQFFTICVPVILHKLHFCLHICRLCDLAIFSLVCNFCITFSFFAMFAMFAIFAICFLSFQWWCEEKTVNDTKNETRGASQCLAQDSFCTTVQIWISVFLSGWAPLVLRLGYCLFQSEHFDKQFGESDLVFRRIKTQPGTFIFMLNAIPSHKICVHDWNLRETTSAK